MKRSAYLACSLTLAALAVGCGNQGPSGKPLDITSVNPNNPPAAGLATVHVLFLPAVPTVQETSGFTLGVNDRPIVLDADNTYDRLPLSAGSFFQLPPDTYTLDIQNSSGKQLIRGAAHALEGGHTYTLTYYGKPDALAEDYVEDDLSSPGAGLTRLRFMNTASDMQPHDLVGWKYANVPTENSPITLASRVPYGGSKSVVVAFADVSGVSLSADTSDGPVFGWLSWAPVQAYYPTQPYSAMLEFELP